MDTEQELLLRGGDPTSDRLIEYVSYPLLSAQERSLVLSWRNRVDIRAAMSDQHEIEAAEHESFCRSLRSDPDSFYFLVRFNHLPCGGVNLKRLSSQETFWPEVIPRHNCWEWGIFLATPAHGLSQAALGGLSILCEAFGIYTLCGKFRRDNQRSRRFHLEKMGLAICGEDESYCYMLEQHPAQLLSRLGQSDPQVLKSSYLFHLQPELKIGLTAAP